MTTQTTAYNLVLPVLLRALEEVKQNETFCARARATGAALADAQADRYDEAAKKDTLHRSLIAMRYAEAATLRTRECFTAEAIRNEHPAFSELLVDVERWLVEKGVDPDYARACLRSEMGEHFRRLSRQGYRLRMLERKRAFNVSRLTIIP